VSDKAAVEAGDIVRTDDTGFAEIAYFDGSRTRLDVNTEFEVIELAETDEHLDVSARMGLGRTWHRVQDLGTGDGSYAVETSVATATVRGTAFLVACPSDGECTFTVLEGSLMIAPIGGERFDLDAPAAVTVRDGEAGEPRAVEIDALLAERWVARNVELDADADFAELDASPDEPEEASGDGELPDPCELFDAERVRQYTRSGELIEGPAIRPVELSGGRAGRRFASSLHVELGRIRQRPVRATRGCCRSRSPSTTRATTSDRAT